LDVVFKECLDLHRHHLLLDHIIDMMLNNTQLLKRRLSKT